jgi:hypothetical protein
MRAGDKYITFNYKIELESMAPIANVLNNGISNVSLRSGNLSFELGAGLNEKDFSQFLKIYKYRRLGSDTKLFDRQLTAGEYILSESQGKTGVQIDLKQFGITLPAKKRVKMETRFNENGRIILNKSELKLSAKSNYIFY